MDEFSDGYAIFETEDTRKTKFVHPPEPNVKLSFGTDSMTYFQYHCKSIPNRFQRWMMLKVFGIKMDVLK